MILDDNCGILWAFKNLGKGLCTCKDKMEMYGSKMWIYKDYVPCIVHHPPGMGGNISKKIPSLWSYWYEMAKNG